MKKSILLIAAILIGLCSYAQTDSSKCKLKPYVSIGVSVGHTDPTDPAINDFSKSSYPSIELGVMGDNVSLGYILGCENFQFGTGRLFHELKTSVSTSLGKVYPYALFGIGIYGESGFHNFIEYGAGFSYMPNKFGYFVQYSNWSRSNYVSLGLTRTF